MNPKVDPKILSETFDVNVVGTVRVTNGFLDLVKAAPEGRIVNVSSYMGSLTLYQSNIDTCAYSVSKTALNMYTVSLARALKDTKVKVNSGHPGWVRTDMGGADADLCIEEGAETSVYLATLPSDGPTGGFFFKKEVLPW
ncbi:short chain dehydrogenase [Strigomonas culicis]|nr:short chain dehydrogenase [Strigomonas culicis]|eukprot:EPY23314.1 short chain dehydrogenase [Strigomonas culicis]